MKNKFTLNQAIFLISSYRVDLAARFPQFSLKRFAFSFQGYSMRFEQLGQLT